MASNLCRVRGRSVGSGGRPVRSRGRPVRRWGGPVRSGGGLVGGLVVSVLVLGLAGVADFSNVAGVAVDVVLDGLEAAVGEEDCNKKKNHRQHTTAGFE